MTGRARGVEVRRAALMSALARNLALTLEDDEDEASAERASDA